MSATTTRPDVSPVPVSRSGRDRLLIVRARIVSALKYASLVGASICILLPLTVVVLASLKGKEEYARTGPFDLPSNWFNFENYATAFEKGGMLRGFFNTAIILGVSITGTVIIGSMAAYALDRFDFRLRKAILALFLLATLVPAVTTQVATFQIVNRLGLYDTRWSAIALFLGTDIISIYIFTQFLRGIPRDLDEAATLDGANHFTIYWRILLPLMKPAIATVVITKGVVAYNEFYIPFLYMPSTELGVMSTSLFRFKGPFGAQWEVISAGTILVIVPTLVVFLLLQRLIYNGFTTGAVK